MVINCIGEPHVVVIAEIFIILQRDSIYLHLALSTKLFLIYYIPLLVSPG